MENGQFVQQQEQQISGVQNQNAAETESSGKSKAEKQEERERARERLKKIEEEASKLRAKYEIGEGGQQEENEEIAAAAALAEKEEADSRSIYVGNVDYDCTPEEVQQHFQNCGTVNRVTIMSDQFGQPKGYAYVEFVEAEAVQSALLLNESELHGRLIKVSPKRTNLPGRNQYRGRRFSRRPFMPGPPFFPSYGYGRVSRSRSFTRYRPY